MWIIALEKVPCFGECEPKLGECGEEAFKNARHRRLLVGVFVVPDPRERFEYQRRDDREIGMGVRPCQWIEPNRVRPYIRIDDMNGPLDPQLVDPPNEGAIEAIGVMSMRVDDAHSPASRN